MSAASPTRRAAFAFGATAVAAGLIPAAANATAAPSGPLVDITRRFRAAEDHADWLDGVHLATVKGPDGGDATYEAFVEADEERHEIHDEVYYQRAETLADAAVLAGHAFTKVSSMTQCDLHAMLRGGQMDDELAEVLNALAGILDVVSRASGLPVTEIGWRDLPRFHAKVLARVEAA